MGSCRGSRGYHRGRIVLVRILRFKKAPRQNVSRWLTEIRIRRKLHNKQLIIIKIVELIFIMIGIVDKIGMWYFVKNNL